MFLVFLVRCKINYNKLYQSLYYGLTDSYNPILIFEKKIQLAGSGAHSLPIEVFLYYKKIILL